MSQIHVVHEVRNAIFLYPRVVVIGI